MTAPSKGNGGSKNKTRQPNFGRGNLRAMDRGEYRLVSASIEEIVYEVYAVYDEGKGHDYEGPVFYVVDRRSSCAAGAAAAKRVMDLRVQSKGLYDDTRPTVQALLQENEREIQRLEAAPSLRLEGNVSYEFRFPEAVKRTPTGACSGLPARIILTDFVPSGSSNVQPLWFARFARIDGLPWCRLMRESGALFCLDLGDHTDVKQIPVFVQGEGVAMNYAPNSQEDRRAVAYLDLRKDGSVTEVCVDLPGRTAASEGADNGRPTVVGLAYEVATAKKNGNGNGKSRANVPDPTAKNPESGAAEGGGNGKVPAADASALDGVPVTDETEAEPKPVGVVVDEGDDNS